MRAYETQYSLSCGEIYDLGMLQKTEESWEILAEARSNLQKVESRSLLDPTKKFAPLFFGFPDEPKLTANRRFPALMYIFVDNTTLVHNLHSNYTDLA